MTPSFTIGLHEVVRSLGDFHPGRGARVMTVRDGRIVDDHRSVPFWDVVSRGLGRALYFCRTPESRRSVKSAERAIVKCAVHLDTWTG